MKHMTTVDARAQFSDIINRAAFGKERVTLMRCAKGKAMPRLLPLQRPNRIVVLTVAPTLRGTHLPRLRGLNYRGVTV